MVFILLVLGFLLGHVTAAFALEDDGRPYKEFAKRVDLNVNSTVAGVMGFEYWSDKEIREYLTLMEKTATRNGILERSNSQCSAFHALTTEDRVIDIRYAFGYFDSSDHGNTIYDGLDWGRSTSIDEGVALAVRGVMLDKCPNDARRLCEFQELTSLADRLRNGETVLSRMMEVQGRQVEVRVTLSYASASPFYDRNTGELKAKQQRYTEASEQSFFGGLRVADYVFYVGHSRNGGGPDFNPPRLMANGHADYMGYYRKAFPGRDRMMRELGNASNKNTMVGLFSCDSNLHFRGRLLTQNAKRRALLTIGTTGSLDYFDVLRGSVGYLEGLLRGTCGGALDDFARVTPKEKSAFQQYNLK